jgi:hypothetical protein
MAEDRPNAAELIETVREFLQDRALVALRGHLAFEVRIAANLLAIALREIEKRPAVAESERRRLATLLESEGELEELETELVRRIRAGEIGATNEALLLHLKQSARDGLEIANPKYLGGETNP